MHQSESVPGNLFALLTFFALIIRVGGIQLS
jgi:hypothetical protein